MQSEAARPFWWLAVGFGLIAVGLHAFGLGPNAGGAVGGSVMMVMAAVVTHLA